WVELGAPWPGEAKASVKPAGGTFQVSEEQRRWWAYQPVRPVAPPTVRNTSWARTAIDHFILAELEKRDIPPAPPADRRTLRRRATFDLTGLPPTPEQVDQFVCDDSPHAFAKAVDRLLASPASGPRSAR